MERNAHPDTLSKRHAKLDKEITKECASPFSDDIEMAQKKKMKLSLKDGLHGIKPTS